MMPYSAVIYLTHKCNLRCKHCFVINKNENFLDTQMVFKVLEDFKKNKVYLVAFTGGDPCLHKDLKKIIAKTHSLGMLPLLGLSGTNLSEEYIKELSQLNLGCVQVSLDGSNEKINSIIRDENSFEEIVENIKLFQKYDVNVNLAICIHDQNYHDIQNILNLCLNLNIYKIKIQFLEDNSVKGLNDIGDMKKRYIIEFCKKFENMLQMTDWIHVEYNKDRRTDLEKIHSKSFIITADGEVKFYDDGEVIGNVEKKLPSEIISEYYAK